MDVTLMTAVEAGITRESLINRHVLSIEDGRYGRRKEIISRFNNKKNFESQRDYYNCREFTLSYYTIDELKKIEEHLNKMRKSFTKRINVCKERNLDKYDKVDVATTDILTNAKKSNMEEAKKTIAEMLNSFFV